MLFWCLGMYASASTWAFNAARGVLAAAHPGTAIVTSFVSVVDDTRRFGSPGAIDIVKSHEISDEAAALRVAGCARRILITIREPRDAVTSLMLSHGYTFEAALRHVAAAAALCRGFARDRRSLTLRYDDGFFDDASTIPRIAAHLGLRIGQDDAAHIADSLSRDAVNAFIAAMPQRSGILRDHHSGDLLEPETQWHSHHANRAGEAGRWRRHLTEEQAAAVARCLD